LFSTLAPRRGPERVSPGPIGLLKRVTVATGWSDGPSLGRNPLRRALRRMHIPGQLTPWDALFHSSVHNNNQRLNLPAGLSSLGSHSA
jgi:hypothetical protein